MIGKPPGTIIDRGVVVEMRRKRRDEAVERLRVRGNGVLLEIGSKIARWVKDQGEALAAADPIVPESLNDREADNWRPMLAIADAAGGSWGTIARKAAVALSGSNEDDESESIRVRLLTDIADILTAGVAATNGTLATFKGAHDSNPKVSSADLVAKLVALDERPWADWRHGKQLTKNDLARLLKPFGIRSGTIRYDADRGTAANPQGVHAGGF